MLQRECLLEIMIEQYFPTKIFPKYQPALTIMIKVVQNKKAGIKSTNLHKMPLKWNYSFIHPFIKEFFEPLEYACMILGTMAQ